MKKINTKRLFAVICIAILTLALCSVGVASAQSDEGETTSTKPKRILERIALNISGADGKITATAKHEFSMFAANIAVTVELYKSDKYCESYTDMTLVGRKTTTNLAKGSTLSYSASTNGKSAYWLAKMNYKIGSGNWVSRATTAQHYDANGNLLND